MKSTVIKGEWKFTAIGSGFKGGLKAMCQNFGVDMEIRDPNRGVIELKKGQKVNLTKHGSSMGEILINLNWSQPQQQRGFFAPRCRESILTLAALFELYDGRKGAVQALGNSFGSLYGAPYIALDGDDRTGTSTDGENLRINGNMISQIRRVLIYTFIYEGAANWRDANGIVTVKCPEIRISLSEWTNTALHKPCVQLHCLRTELANLFEIEKVVRFFQWSSGYGQRFNWGLRWVAGHK